MPRKAQFGPPVNVAPAGKRTPHKVFKRRGSVSNVERDFVTQFVQDQPRELSTRQVNALATVMRRSRETVKEVVAEARDRFVEQADRYVEIHRSAVESALEGGDNETALKGSQWYLEHVAAEGIRIVDKGGASGPTGSKIVIGVAIGGVGATGPIPIPAITVEKETV